MSNFRWKPGHKAIYLCVLPPPHPARDGLPRSTPHNSCVPCGDCRPSFSITLLRSAWLPPTYARFGVPLWFNKLDLRDYLQHVYDVKVHGVTSYVKQQAVRQGDPALSRPTPRRWHRPRPLKMMTVRLDRPFVWPAEIEDAREWNKEEVKMQHKEQKERQKLRGPTGDTIVDEERRKALREQAQALMDGKVKWKSGQQWESGRLLSRP